MWKLLIVDDDESARELLTIALKDKAKCDVAANAREALDAYTQSIRKGLRYDLILLDITLPDRSGIKVLETIREKESRIGYKKKKKTPVIIVTGTSEKETVLEACKKGCTDYLVKPIENSILLKKIEKNILKE